MLHPRRAFALAGLFVAALPLFAASASKPTSASAKPDEKPKTFSDLFDGLQFRNIGPFRGGRVTAVTGVRHNPLTFYFGATGGGVWKTSDGGSNWEAVSDKDFKTGSVGAIAVSESDPNVVYVGMGEAPIRGNVSHGDGVYKSTDAGLTWTSMGLKGTRQIARVRVHPTDPDLVYVAAQGHVWGKNADRGIYRSRDGGRTWAKVLYVNDETGASDLAMDPSNPRTLYAAFWQIVRRPWELVDGGPASALYRSTDGGDTWKKIEAEGLPSGLWGKVGVAASAARPGRVYAFIEARDGGGLFVSDDRGVKWKHVNDEHKIRQRAWYYAWVYPDPKNADTVYLPNVNLHRSTDGGKTFSNLSSPHGDHHDLWIDPDDSNRMILGNDGGATISFNGGRTWSTQNNQPTAQFYRVTTDDRFPYWVYGSQQDNSNVCIPSGVTGAAIDMADWHSAGGGESGWIAPDPKNPDVVYAGEYGGQITRYDHRTRQAREIGSWPQLADGHATRDLKYRFQWNAPILISRHDPKTLYHASQILLRSRDEGETWEEASPDLTRNDGAKQGDSGGPIARDITGVEVYDTIFAISESPVEPGVLWAGSDDGLVHVTRDGAKTWQNVTPKGMPEWIQINAIDASPHEKGVAYVAATMYKFDNFAPYLYRTKDYGKTWTKIVTGIPGDAFTRVVREDPARRGLLYAGTETGLYVSFDDGASWRAFQRNLPATPITDLTVKNGDLVVATQGRAFWILDDLTPVRQWNESVPASGPRLFAPRKAVRMQTERVDEEDEPLRGVGTNLPNGVIVNYWLSEKPAKGEKVLLEILSEGKVIRSFSNQKPEKDGDLKEQAVREEEEKDRDKPLEPKAGLNRFVWDMRVFKPTLVPKAVFNEGTKTPPKVGPGSYQVRLTAGGKSFTETAVVEPHPGGFASAADLKAQYDLLASIRDRLSETHATVLKIRDARAQAKELGDRAARLGKGDALAKRAAALSVRLTAVEEKLINPNIKANEDDLNFEPKLDHDLTNLAGIVASADAKPLASSVRYYDLLKTRLAAIVGEFDRLMEGEVAEFNRAADALQIPRVVPAPKVETAAP
ncbi:MAG: glycosyl hydrolase [Acidobacteria bacterium]|nr:glycosyl hydrolase [Acidobacteriota bacterium]MCA1612400.1 glycosyl hydrolase [Acidobacteriota bacterium]